MKWIVGFGVALLGLALSAQATVLTFDPDNLLADPGTWSGWENTVAQAYGDRVSASPDGAGFTYGSPNTPHVVVDYAPTTSTGVRYISPTSVYQPDGITYNYGPTGDLLGTIYNGYGILPNETTSNKWMVTLTADPGYEVVLNSFDLAGIWGATGPGSNITVTGNTTFQQAYANIPMAGGHVTVSPGVQGQVVTILFDDVVANYTAADNFNFTEVVVPEPATVALLALAALVMWRRR